MAETQFWQRKSFQRVAIQSVFLAVLGVGLVTAVTTARAKLAAQGMTTGFDFLWKSTGWEINFNVLTTNPTDPYWWYLLSGLVNTLWMGIVGLTGATIIGLAVGLLRSGRNPAGRLLGTVYIETFRNLPLIVQLFFWYAVTTSLPPPREALAFGGMLLSSRGIYLPGLNIAFGSALVVSVSLILGLVVALWFSFAKRFRKSGIRRRFWALGSMAIAAAIAIAAAVIGHEPGSSWLSLPERVGLKLSGGIRLQPEFLSLAIAITMFGGAYVGEIVRGGFKAVGRGQTEAAQSLGLTPWQTFSRVRMPLAFRAMLPILTNQYVWLIKATTLGIAVGFSDLFMVIASSVQHAGQTFELIGILMAGFLTLNFSLAAVLNAFNRAIALKGKQGGAAA